MIFGPLHAETWHAEIILVNRRGETLYNEERWLCTWKTAEEAQAWIKENAPEMEMDMDKQQNEWEGLPLLEVLK